MSHQQPVQYSHNYPHYNNYTGQGDAYNYPPQHSPYYHHELEEPHPMPQRSSSYSMYHKDGSYISDISDVGDRESGRAITPQTQQSTEAEVTGFWRNLFPNSIACRLYLLVVLLETIVDLGIEADILFLVDRIANGSDDIQFRRMPVYLTVFGLAHLFQLLLALDAVHARNTLQFLFLTFLNFMFMVYAIIQKTEILEIVPKGQTGISHIPVDVLTTIIPIVIAVAEVAYIALGWKIYTEFGWQVYKRLGADRNVKRMYMHFQIFVCLVKFDVFFWIGFGVQWIFLVLKKSTSPAEFYVTIGALPTSIALLVVGHLAARHEKKWMMGVFMSGCVAACIYFVYKLYKIIMLRTEPDFKPVFKTLTVFSSLAALLLVITFVWGCIVMRNFGQGLKSRVSKHQHGASVVHLGRVQPARRASHFHMGSHPHRLSID